MADVKLVNFKPEDFNCKGNCCGFGYEHMQNDFIRMFLNMRGIAQVPFILTSAYRCPTYNITVGGRPTSSHTKGYAVDIRCLDSNARFMMLKGAILSGINRLGIGPDFIHVDTDPNKPPRVAWTYYDE